MKPTIQLRRWYATDAANLWEASQDPALARQMPVLPDIDSARHLLESHYQVSETGMVWCVDCDGRASGLIGISYSGQGDGAIFDRGWVFYWATEHIRGQKIMKPLVKAVCDFAQGLTINREMTLENGRTARLDELVDTESPKLRRLELGYRTNNPASRALAIGIGFVEEGIEREKFCYNGELFDAVIAGRLLSDVEGQKCEKESVTALHHLELWTGNFAQSYPEWNWLLTELGLVQADTWSLGCSWKLADGSYFVLEQSPDVSGPHQRTRAGMNHLALTARPETIKKIRTAAPTKGWQELFAEKFPHAGGEDHYALYLENSEGFEIEIVGKDR